MLRVLLEDMNYDFDLQEWRALQEPVSVSRNDVLITECVYKSTDRTTITKGGLSTREEMCLAFLMYYPRMEIVSCMSQVSLTDLGRTLNLSSKSGEEVFTTLSGWMWNDARAKELERNVLETNQTVIVVSRTGLKYVPVKIPDIPEKKVTPCVRMLSGRAPGHTGRPAALLLTALFVWLTRGEG
ncbi:DBH-like monooxygenase protein 2 homolog [Hypanus sabinus]|uniref:DBH-like monooxygenase protein 2 homolog n=1 Tax=Hypanus sabinus TaxID=79690 RepID=UPI0028C4984C|nr:DBH-like monooxygenase protein 2 homolog [Hypanus sabinus]